MQLISPPIDLSSTGIKVRNLQDALFFILNKKVIRTFQLPDTPSHEDLIQLTQLLKSEYTTNIFGDGTRQLVMFFQLQQGLSDSLRGAVEETTSRKLNDILTELGAYANDKNEFIVKGFIRNTKGAGVSALVKAYDHDLRRTELLGETNTDLTGYYEIQYELKKFENAEKSNADLIIDVFQTNSPTKISSEIFFNALAVQEINLTLPSPSEWEQINAQILPLLKGQKKTTRKIQKSTNKEVFTDLLPEDLVQVDLMFLTKETGLALEALRIWSLAHINAKKRPFKISPELLYGWYRMGLSTDLKDLWKTSYDELTNTIKGAVTKNIVSITSDETGSIISNIKAAHP